MFAAGVALRRVEAMSGDDVAKPPADVSAAASAAAADEVATGHETAPAYMAQAMLGFNEQLERIAEVAVVVLLGGMLTMRYVPREAIWFVPMLLLVIRPTAVFVGLASSSVSGRQKALMAWFGIRGVGSVYYLAYAIQHGVEGEMAQQLTALTLTTVAASIVIHGVSVTPLMTAYTSHRERRERRSITRTR